MCLGILAEFATRPVAYIKQRDLPISPLFRIDAKFPQTLGSYVASCARNACAICAILQAFAQSRSLLVISQLILEAVP